MELINNKPLCQVTGECNDCELCCTYCNKVKGEGVENEIQE